MSDFFQGLAAFTLFIIACGVAGAVVALPIWLIFAPNSSFVDVWGNTSYALFLLYLIINPMITSNK